MKNGGIQRESFILYKSFYGPISQLTDEQLGRLFRAIYLWQIDGEATPEPDIQIAFGFFINQFRIDGEKYEARCDKNRENILKRWEKEHTNVYDGIRMNTKNSDNENDNDNDNVCIDGADDSHHAPTHKRFVKPTLDQVREYCTSRGNNIDPVRFVDYYESIGWKVGKNPMKDWKACVRTWERQDHPQPCDDPGKVICGKAIDSLYDD